MRLGPTVDGSAEGPDASLRSGLRFFPISKDTTFRYSQSAVGFCHFFCFPRGAFHFLRTDCTQRQHMLSFGIIVLFGENRTFCLSNL